MTAAMRNIEKITEYIKTQTIAECEEISRTAAEDCERIRAEFNQAERDEYWKFIDIGTKEAERRLESLKELAAAEAKKQIDALQTEMLDEAFTLAAGQFLGLPGADYKKILKKLGIDTECGPDALLARYKDELTPDVISALFD